MTVTRAYNYQKAPLPFMGQKRDALAKFSEILQDKFKNEGEDRIFVDVFGGSGLLSRCTKDVLPKSHVVYNDFENYSASLKETDKINQLKNELSVLLSDCPKGKKISKDKRGVVIDKLNSIDFKIDLKIISSWLLFSSDTFSSFSELEKKTLWNNLPLRDYQKSTSYLENLEIIHLDYRDCMAKYANNPKVVWILDPPYTNTVQAGYKQDKYFNFISLLELVDLMYKPFIFFDSVKSEAKEYLDYLIKTEKRLDLSNYETYYISKNISYNSDNKQYMLVGY